MPETENKSKRKGYFSSMTTELKKVIWPSPAQVTKNTGITIAFVFMISVILIILNIGFETLNNVWWSFWK